LSWDDLSKLTSLNQESLQEALNALKRHDVVAEVEGKWRIIVELFRLWLKSDQRDRI
jgi:DNA-binding IclR family transcriptional regulator